MSPSPRIGEVRLWGQGWAESGTTALVGGGLAPKGEDVRTTCHGEVGQRRAGLDFRSGGRVGQTWTPGRPQGRGPEACPPAPAAPGAHLSSLSHAVQP